MKFEKKENSKIVGLLSVSIIHSMCYLKKLFIKKPSLLSTLTQFKSIIVLQLIRISVPF